MGKNNWKDMICVWCNKPFKSLKILNTFSYVCDPCLLERKGTNIAMEVANDKTKMGTG